MVSADLQAVAHEVAFWQRFVRTARFSENWASKTPNPELRPGVAEFFRERPEARVLDVGSGVVSLLRGTVPVKNLVPADPLSPLYEIVFDYPAAGIRPPIPIAAEELEFEERFDVVHISNALDHCQDPAEAYRRLWRAVRPGGWLFVQGFFREAEHEKGEGFHRWNLHVHGRDLSVWPYGDPGSAFELDRGDYAELLRLDTGRHWILWWKQKVGP